jgi:predicted transcriptional regulator
VDLTLSILHFKKSLTILREIYSDNLSVNLIAEEVQTCSLEDDASEIKFNMESLDFDYYGVKSDGRVIGYIVRSELGEGLISNYTHPFKMDDLVSESTSLIELLQILRDKHPVFVLEKNQVKKLITVADLQKQPIRMLVFGLISLLEMNLLQLIKEHYPEEGWKEHLSSGRLEKMDEVYKLRKEKNEGLGLIECLQLSDKGTIIRKTPELLEKLEFLSKREVDRFFRSIEELRNNTAHSQKYVYDDFNIFLDNITRVEKIITLI